MLKAQNNNDTHQKLLETRLRQCALFDRFMLKLGLVGKPDWNGIDTAFIVSTGRTGTKFLARFIAGVAGFNAVHEPRPDLLKYALTYAQGKHSFDNATKFIEQSRRTAPADTRRRACSVYVESNNRLFSLLKPLRALFPNAKIIHIVRDGRSYVRSGMARKWYTKRDYKKREHAYMFPDDPYFDKWNSMTRFEKICWRWQKKDGFITRDFTEIAEPKIKVTFEDIFEDPDRKGLYKLARFLGITDEDVSARIQMMGQERVNTNKAFEDRINAWPKWDDQLKKSFDRIAAEHMKQHYNYTPMSYTISDMKHGHL
ncbi:MAG: sulfotransferase [Lentisphaerae bacterium]|nr:sulfotransferase [Lentisphaerota bacterium]